MLRRAGLEDAQPNCCHNKEWVTLMTAVNVAYRSNRHDLFPCKESLKQILYCD